MVGVTCIFLKKREKYGRSQKIWDNQSTLVGGNPNLPYLPMEILYIMLVAEKELLAAEIFGGLREMKMENGVIQLI